MHRSVQVTSGHVLTGCMTVSQLLVLVNSLCGCLPLQLQLPYSLQEEHVTIGPTWNESLWPGLINYCLNSFDT